MSVDTLGYVKRLEAAGVPRAQAEAHAEAMRDEIAPQLVTNDELGAAVDRLENKIEIETTRLENKIGIETARLENKIDIATVRLDQRIDRLDAKIDSSLATMTHHVETMIWKSTVATLGGGLAIGGLLIRFFR